MIAIDWGTSSLRAWRLDADGEVIDTQRSDIGALSCEHRHAEVVAALVAAWDDARLIACGMAGARGGWREAPYVACPADAHAIAALLIRVDTAGTALDGREVTIVPGVADRRGDVPDVMRGEETQIVGLLQTLDEAPAVACLPGTHSKWVAIDNRAIAGLRTFMTGEMYGLLHGHGVLSRSLAPGADFDADAFDVGVARSADAGGLLHHLFGIRSRSLFGQLEPGSASSYLSGLLIGHEVRAQLPLHARVHLIGGARLVARYERALSALGVASRTHAEALAARGIHAIARAGSGARPR